MSKVRNSRDILVCRFFLGVIEAGFFPGVLYIMSCWYKRNEIGMLSNQVKLHHIDSGKASDSAYFIPPSASQAQLLASSPVLSYLDWRDMVAWPAGDGCF